MTATGASSLTFEEAVRLHRTGDTSRALDIYTQLICLHASEGLLLHLIGVSLHQLGQSASGLRWLRRAAAIVGSDPLLQHNLGEAAWAAGRGDLATRAYRAVLEQQTDFIESRISHAMLLREVGHFALAAGEARRAVVLAPDNARAHLAKGLTHERGQEFERAVSIDPTYVGGWTNLGAIFLRDGQPKRAARATRCALVLLPTNGEAWINLGSVQLGLGYAHDAVVLQTRGIIGRTTPGLHSNILFSMLSDPAVDAAAVLAESRRWERQHAPPRRRASLSPSLPSNPDRRLVVGYLSGDFRRHPVAGNIEELLRRHDRQRFSVHCYAEIGAPDAVTERFRALADRWVPTIGMDDAAVAERIRNDGVDILVFLGGHTASNRLAIAAYRSAPIQVSFHAPATTGLTTIDYWLTDASLSPAGSEVHFSEQLYRLPTFYTFQAPPAVPIAGPQPAGADVVFGSFNNPTKLNDRVFDAWAQILAQLPRSRLRLGYHGHFLDPALQGRVLAALAGVPGVDGRVEFLSAAADGSAHFARLGQTDIILDTFPFAGATSTFEALWMGVPVVTLAGESFVGRVGVSLAPHVGLADFVAPDQDAYVDRAVRLAQDEPLRLRLRRSMRERLTASPLMDYHAQTLDLEQAYKNMWKSG